MDASTNFSFDLSAQNFISTDGTVNLRQAEFTSPPHQEPNMKRDPAKISEPARQAMNRFSILLKSLEQVHTEISAFLLDHIDDKEQRMGFLAERVPLADITELKKTLKKIALLTNQIGAQAEGEDPINSATRSIASEAYLGLMGTLIAIRGGAEESKAMVAETAIVPLYQLDTFIMRALNETKQTG